MRMSKRFAKNYINSLVFTKEVKDNENKIYFKSFYEEGFNKFYSSKTTEDIFFNCFGYNADYITEDLTKVTLVINPIIEDKYRVSNDKFNFSKVSLKLVNSPYLQTYNTVTFIMNTEDMIFYGNHECQSAMKFLNEYLKEIIRKVDNDEIKKDYDIF